MRSKLQQLRRKLYRAIPFGIFILFKEKKIYEYTFVARSIVKQNFLLN